MSNATFTGADLMELLRDAERFAGSFGDLMGRVENERHLKTFVRGQLSTIERKGLEPMADAAGVAPRPLQFFFSDYQWDEDGVRQRLQRRIAAEYAGDDGIFVIDETSDAKKGTLTAGVQRQYCGESGKVDNCIVSVHLAYRRRGFHCLLDGELFLPESWDNKSTDKDVLERRKRACVPDDVGYVGKAEMSVVQLRRAAANGVAGRFVAADEFYGGKPWWRDEVAGMGLTYVVEVPRTTRGWLRRPLPGTPGKKTTKGCHEKRVHEDAASSVTVEALKVDPRGLRFERWQTFIVKNTTKGPELWKFKVHTFHESRPNERVGKAKRLLVAVSPVSGEVKYFLSNAPAKTQLRKLVRVAFARYWIERCFQDCKTDLGMNHAELRGYRGIKRHLVLTTSNYFFLQDWRHKRTWPDYDTMPSISQLADAAQRLLEVSRDGITPARALPTYADRYAAQILLTQGRNAKARRSHTKTTLRKLEELLGLRLDQARLPTDADLPMHVTVSY